MESLFLVLRDRRFRSKLLTIAFPIAVQNLIYFGVSAADTLMLGRVGEIQLSAAAVANQFSFAFMVISFGVSGGCGVLAAQYWGAGDKEKVRQIFAFMYRVMAVLSLSFASIAFFFPEEILRIIITDPEVIAYGVDYLRIMGGGYFVWGITASTIGLLRATGTVKISIVVSLVSLIISVSLNYVLIFGNFGFPALGVTGAAIGTVTARVCEFIVITVYLFKVEKKIGIGIRDLFCSTKGVTKGFLTHGTPVVVNEIFWVSAHFLLGVIIGRMGREFVAANAIGGLLVQLVGVVVFGISSATGAIIGNTIGEGEHERARQYANGMLVVSVLLGLMSFAVVQAVRLPLISFYSLSDTARVYALQLTHVVSLNMIFMPIAVVSLMGTLRGGGDTKFVMVVDAIFAWLIAIPLGALAGLVLHWPIYIVFLILRSEDIFKAAVVLWRVPRGKWLRDVTQRNVSGAG